MNAVKGVHGGDARAAGGEPSVEPRSLAVGVDDIYSVQPDQLEHIEKGPSTNAVRTDADDAGAALREHAVGAPYRPGHRYRELFSRKPRDDFTDLGRATTEVGRDEELEDMDRYRHSPPPESAEPPPRARGNRPREERT